MYCIQKVLIAILIIFSMQSPSAQIQNFRYLTKVFEQDTSITLHTGVCNITICSYNFELDKQFVEAILISPSEHFFKFPAIILLSDFERGANECIPTGIEFARQGFVCMAISQPGSGRSRGILDYAGKKTISAITTGYTKLRKESFVDPDKIGICGYGGGALTALSLAAELKDLQAAALVSGIYDLNKAKKDSLFHNINLSQEELESRSSMGLIDKVHCPILLIHDKEAKSGLVEQSYLLRDKLKKGNKEYEIKEFEIQGMQERRKIFIQYQTYYHIDDFFKRKYALDKDNIIIKTHNKTKAELITKTKLDSLISNLDLSKYIFSDRVLIKEGLRSKSNPFLTIATQHNHNDYLLLATFLHEQIHWYCKTKVLQRKITQLIKRKFPDFPIGLDKGSGRNEFDTYIHFPVNYFEYKALIEFSGKKKARSTLLSRDIYSRIYQTIFDNEEYFDSLFSKKS